MNFENINCDGCSRPLEKNQDTVVCPVCGTPQHRECYEKNGECVNASKHDLGFEWKAPNRPEAQNLKTKTCSACGTLNDENAKVCSECGNPFESEKPGNVDDDLKDEKGFFKTIESDAKFAFNDPDELPELDELIEERVKVIAPGISAEQRREQLCGHEIGETVSFIGNNVSSYVAKFRKKEHMNKHTFNWAAFVFTPIWFFWRRLYKQGIVYMTILLIISILMTNPLENFMTIYQGIIDSGAQTISSELFSQLQSAMLPVMLLEGAVFILHLVAGFTADGMYHKYCTRSLNKIDYLRRTEDNLTSISYYLKHSSTGFLATLIAMIVYYVLPSLFSYIITK